MNAHFAKLSIVLIVALAIPTARTRAAPTDGSDARKTLRAAAFEAAPPVLGQGRFRLSARLHAAPAPAVTGEMRTLKLHAVLAPKATVASCPLPGAIFSDGYESP